MTDEKLNEILNLYEFKLKSLIGNQAEHLKTMIPKIREFILMGRYDKTMRWLGFMQGVLWANGVYELEELKRHNMPSK